MTDVARLDRLRGTLGVLVGIVVMAFTMSCGISLRAEGSDSEVFQKLTFDERVAAGEEVPLMIDYEQPYPVGLDIECDIFKKGRKLEEGERGQVFFESFLPTNENGGPVEEATPISGTTVATFIAPPVPGRYVVRCLTTGDENNAIAEPIEVVAGATPAP
ncbi:MAG: hypothetical protein WBD55_11960 [Dehalococcoidia bacterium]